MKPRQRAIHTSIVTLALLTIALATVAFADPNPLSPGVPPAATVSLLPAHGSPPSIADSAGASLVPTDVSATLPPAGCVSLIDTLTLPANVRPEQLDLMFCMDLTGSMGDELSNVKNNTLNIVTQINGLVANSQYGVMSHMDYPNTYSGCGYTGTYGDSFHGDYPYLLGQPITSNISDLGSAINALLLGNGVDGPEDYSRPLFESYADPAVGWRPGAKRIVITWGDDVPHDCVYDAILGGATSTGPDPGRDSTAGTPDDLGILAVLDGMRSNNVTLIALHSGIYLSLWRAYAQRTGGDAFQINPDGTIPGGTDIATFIASLVRTSVASIDTLRIASCDPAYSGWVRSVTPASYNGITLDRNQTFPFGVEICVPPGTPSGVNCFDVCALGDGAEYARQHVCITVGANQPPVALCKNVTVPADSANTARVLPSSVDNGSYDPDGDAITLALQPPGPFPVGTTPVILIVTDSGGQVDSCRAQVTVTPIGCGSYAPLNFCVIPNRLNLNSRGGLVAVVIRTKAPLKARDIDLASLKLNGVAILAKPCPRSFSLGRMLWVWFSRHDLLATLSPGNHVPVVLTGTAHGACILDTSYVEVKPWRIHKPCGGDRLIAGSNSDVSWEADPDANSVTVQASFDNGATWQTVATNAANTGHYMWRVPGVTVAAARVAVVMNYRADENAPTPDVQRVESATFSISGVNGVEGEAIGFALQSPNPVIGPFTVRFSLVSGPAAKLEVFDVGGRQLLTRDLDSRGSGWRTVSLGNLPVGMYVVRLSQAGRSLSSRVIVIR